MNRPTEATHDRPGRGYTTTAFILALLGLAMFPLGGLVGLVCGYIGYSRGDRPLGLWAMVVSAISFVASFFVAAWVLD
jgi:hypothetical protein